MTITVPATDDPGDWGITWADLLQPPDDVTDPGQQQQLIDGAVATVWYLTGKQFGVHTIDPPVQPCLRCRHPRPYLCSCYYYATIDLDPSEGEHPVVDVVSVTVDGVELEPDQYGIVDARWLVRTPQGARWPACNDLADPTIELSWRYGRTPTADLVVSAVSPLVGQLWRAANRQPCSLDPSIVQTVQREGISFALISPGKSWERGYTGNAQIDAACVRAWPLGPECQQAPGFFDPAAHVQTASRFERP